MDKHELSRRKLLAGLATAGGAGGLVGTGTAAFFSDEELFANNSLNAGSLRLAVGNDAESDSDRRIFEVGMDSPEGSTTFPVTLPELDRLGNENNPAYVWLRTSCPDPEDPPVIAESLDVTLSYACGDGDVIASGSVVRFKNALSDGIRLDPDCELNADPDCLEPNDSVQLRLDWDLNDDYAGEEFTTLKFEFTAQQCRHNDGTRDPFPDEECELPWHGISNIGFCSSSGDPIDPEITAVTGSNGEDKPVIVDWETDVEVDCVQVFYGFEGGPRVNIYDYRDDDTKMSGTVTSNPNDPNAAIRGYEVNPKPTPSGGDPTPYNGASEASHPCGTANALLDGEDITGSKAKLEYNEQDEEFVEVGP